MRTIITGGLAALACLGAALPISAVPAAAAPPTYETGLDAARRGDYAAARAAWQTLAERGDAKAQFSLGFMYAHGDGVKQDFAAAAHWYRRAAEQDDTRAQNNLGMMYGLGEGVPQDYRLSWMWFSLAADKGYADAVRGRGLAAQEMSQDEVTDARRMAREWRERHPR